MAEMDGSVDRAFLVSVADLRNICHALTDEKREFRLAREDEKQVAVHYNDGPDDLNALCYTFPIVANLCLPKFLAPRVDEAALMVCLHVYTGTSTRRGLYLEGDNLLGDFVEDWEKFWGPLEAALMEESKA